ncbi:MAG: hypothetical protein QOE45_1995 [Frankiaceae bacterium]|jgi:hypothetical protein|nr:hypothetical protein [Frankiaceae bacterium]
MATDDGQRTRPTLTASDLAAGVPVAVLAVLATVSLAWAHAHHHSLPAVLLTTLLVLAGLGYGLLRLGGRPRIVADRTGLLVVLGCGALAAVMFLPGFSYGVSDKDPGGYVAHAVEIARGGSYSFTDPLLAEPDLPVELVSPGARLPGIWARNLDTGLIVPQFYHLWPALLATAYDVAGFGGITVTTPLVGVIAVMALAGLLRRVGGLVAAGIGGVLLSTNMLQVWQSKYPTSEVFAEAVFVGTLLCVVVAIQERWRPAAFVAGLLAGVGFLNRADGWLLVMLTAAVLGVVAVTRRADGEVAWGAAGLAALLPYACWQAYGAARTYTYLNVVPGLRRTLLLFAVLVVGAFAARLLLRRPVERVLETVGRQRFQQVAGFAICAVYALLMVVGFLRPLLFGESHFVYLGQVLRSYDEQNLRRLAWFFTLPGFALAGLGLAAVALRRWRAATWAVVLPTLLLLPVFAYKAQNSTRLMWWARRYVPHVLPGLIVLMSLALAFAVAWQWRGRRPLRIPALLAAAALAAVFLSQSLPLRSHDEWHGSFGVGERIAALSGDRRGVYLWQRAPYCCAAPTALWATPVWLERGEVSVLMPYDAVNWQSYVNAYRKRFAADPVFVVWTGHTPPPLTGITEVAHLTGTLPFWEESDIARPSKERPIPYDLTVYRVD